jgi:hypothetical protein
MARTVAQYHATTSADIQTAVDAALAALTNPTIRGLKINVRNLQRRIGREYNVLLTYDTGGSALATPFHMKLFEYATPEALLTALQAYISGNSYFFAAPFLYVIDDTVHTPLYGAMLLYNTTTGASANFTPLNP